MESIKHPKRRKKLVSAYIMLLGMTVLTAIASVVFSFTDPRIHPASFSDLVMSPIAGMLDAARISLFMIIFGGCMGIVNKIGAIDAGVKVLISRMHGKELHLVPLVMAVFAFLGTSYGFYGESIPFYALLSAALYLAGYDTLVAAATVLLGAGIGCLASTVNPFCTGIAIAILNDLNISCNTGIVVGLGALLLVACYLIALTFILRYAKRVKNNPEASMLSDFEKAAAKKKYSQPTLSSETDPEPARLTKVQKRTLILFALTFLVMIIGFVPWDKFGMSGFLIGEERAQQTQTLDKNELEQKWNASNIGSKLEVTPQTQGSVTTDSVVHPAWSATLTGHPLGQWFFEDASAWFFIMAIVISLSAHLKEQEAIDAFLEGAGSIVGVAFIIGFARGISHLMNITGLDMVLLNNAAQALQGLPPAVFVPMSFIVYLLLSIVITSTSALASLSMPIMGPLCVKLGFAPEVMVMIFSTANGLANLCSPMGLFLPGLMLACVNYSTWLKWAKKPILVIGLVCVVVLTIAMLAL